ncbi:MAG: hypothetical protein ABR911_03900 [Syntrophales bacterium]
MEEVIIEIIEPYERQGNDVIVNFRRIISVVGLPPKTEIFFLRLEDYANASDQQIQKYAMAKAYKHVEARRDDP